MYNYVIIVNNSIVKIVISLKGNHDRAPLRERF